MNRAKRSACNRCHGQKMKCFREPDQAKCNRCLPSQSECVFGPSRKAGRPKASRTLNPAPTSPASRRRTDSRAFQTKHRLPSCDGAFTSSAENFEISMPTPTDAVDAATMSPDRDTFVDSPFLTSHANTHDIDVFGAGGTFITEHEDICQEALHEFMTLFPEPRPASSANRNLHRQSARFEPRNSVMDNVGSQSAVCQLSAFSASLYASVDSYTRNEEKAMCAASMDELGKMTADIIQNSQTFQSILGLFVEAVSTDYSNTPDTPTMLQILTAYIRLTQLHHSLYMQIKSLLLSSTTLTSVSASVPSAAALGLQSVSEPILPAVFPDLALGGLSLASFARFQLKFLVQVCVHELGMIESTLGLPAGCRVNDTEGASGLERSILAASDGKMRSLVWTVLIEAEQPLHGIRRTLIELREALRGSIQI